MADSKATNSSTSGSDFRRANGIATNTGSSSAVSSASSGRVLTTSKLVSRLTVRVTTRSVAPTSKK